MIAKIEKDISKSFWKEYEEADYLKRRRMIESLPIIKVFTNKKLVNELIEKKLMKNAIITGFNSYFEDLINYKNEQQR